MILFRGMYRGCVCYRQVEVKKAVPKTEMGGPGGRGGGFGGRGGRGGDFGGGRGRGGRGAGRGRFGGNTAAVAASLLVFTISSTTAGLPTTFSSSQPLCLSHLLASDALFFEMISEVIQPLWLPACLCLLSALQQLVYRQLSHLVNCCVLATYSLLMLLSLLFFTAWPPSVDSIRAITIVWREYNQNCPMLCCV